MGEDGAGDGIGDGLHERDTVVIQIDLHDVTAVQVDAAGGHIDGSFGGVVTHGHRGRVTVDE